jgi:hypothetical protein
MSWSFRRCVEVKFHKPSLKLIVPAALRMANSVPPPLRFRVVFAPTKLIAPPPLLVGGVALLIAPLTVSDPAPPPAMVKASVFKPVEAMTIALSTRTGPAPALKLIAGDAPAKFTLPPAR